jgi:hypothetical protein
MHKTITSFSLPVLMLITPGNVQADKQQVITDDGREVLLKEDGTWIFQSNDRFANTNDGRRVRLKDDGSWEYVGNAPMATASLVRTTGLEMKLEKVVVEKYEKKVQKNVRVRTRMVFYVNVDVSPLQKESIAIEQDNIAHIDVRDDAGKSYPVVSIQPSTAELEPDSKTVLEIRADGAPTVFSKAKIMQITFNPGMLNTSESISLSYRVDDFDEKKVSSFD